METNAVIYVRISSDPSGREIGVATQEEDCRKLAAHHGLRVWHVYSENDTSAFKQKTLTLATGERVRRVVRPKFRAALDDLASDRASALLVYDLDRAVRDPRDLEDLIDARILHGFRVWSVTGSLRLDTDADVAMARVLVAMANKSSADTARRVRRACERKAEQGLWHGHRAPFGYRVEDAHLQVVPEQAALVREATARVLGGDSVYRVARDWNERGIRSGRGGRWTAMILWRVLQNPVLVGDREYRPISPDGRRVAKPVFTARGQWEPILERDVWDALVAEMDRRKSSRARNRQCNKRMTPFSGLVQCAQCGRRMNKRGDRYVCQPTERGACNRAIFFDETNWIIESAVLKVLSSDVVKEKVGKGTRVDDLQLLARSVDDQRGKVQALDDDYYDGILDRAAWLRQRERMSQALEGSERAFRSALSVRALETSRLGTIEDEWATHGPIWQHDVASLVLERVLVHPSPTDIPRTVVRRRDESDEEFEVRKCERRLERAIRRLELVWIA